MFFLPQLNSSITEGWSWLAVNIDRSSSILFIDVDCASEASTHIIVLEGDGSLLHGVSPPEVLWNIKSSQLIHHFSKTHLHLNQAGMKRIHSLYVWTCQVTSITANRRTCSSVGTCESSQLDTAGHVVIEEDSSTFVVALDDHIQSLRADAVACCHGRRSQSSCYIQVGVKSQHYFKW